MKSIVICVTIFLFKTDAYVTNNVNADTTTKLPVGYHEEFRKSSDNSTRSDYFVKDQSGYIYLDDVVFGLKIQNWTSEELPCLNATLHLIKSLQNFTLWSVWEWDSISSQPLGILSGNRYQLGNFDQCMSSPWSTYHPEIKTQYCLAEVALETNEHVKKKTLDEIEPYGNALDLIQHNTPFFRPLKYLTWGACVPACCERRSVERLVGAVLARSHLGAAGLRPRIHVNETCQRPDEPKKFDAAFYAFFSLSGFLVLIALVCTILKKPDSEDRSLKNAIFNVFCIKQNSKDLLKMKRDGIEVIYGIRYLTICFITTCHQSSMIDVGPISNGIKMDESLNVGGWFILHDDLLVDTFFVISAFLVAKGLLEYRRIPNVPLLILKRYLRLVVALAVVVFFMTAVFSHTGSGPLWNRFSDEEVGACRDSWWLNLLMISNYVNPERICVVVTWYIPCDFHFFVVTVLCYTLYRRCPRIGVVVACVLTAASIIVPGYINYVNKLHAIQLFTYDFLMNPRINRQFLLMYIKSHTRAAAYIVGFFAGCLFVKYKDKGAVRMSRTRSVIHISAALTVMMLVAFLGVSYQLRSYSPLEGHVYAALNRPVFALAIAWFILTCVFGQVPLVTGFLQWYAWVPLSRLAYGVYLVHFSVIIRNVAIARNPEYYDSFNVVITSLGVIAVSTLLAFLLWLFFEAPANRLLVMSLKRLYAKKIAEAITTNGTTPETQVRTNAGYIEDNLPDTIQCSSKM